MLLALDVGNTNITLGVFDGEELLFVSRMATDASRMEDQYAIELRDILHLYGVRRAHISGAVISSVVPKLTGYLANGVEKLFSVKPLIVSYETVKGFLPIAISQPETTGPDLIAGCAGAKAFYSCPCIVIDMGTATTLVAMDKEGAMVGGAIVPGMGVSLDALTQRAALLGLCDRMEEELGYPCRVVATGGLAGMVVPHCRRKVECSDTLLLDGLKVIYQWAGHESQS